jgi:hypothetical protein
MQEPAVAEFNVPKCDWPAGPWHNEPDRVDFEHAGFACLALRNHYGAWCGYVAVPPGHPMHGRPYDDVDAEVHGGLTYSHACDGAICHVPRPGESDNVWWLGFDCSHAWDLVPALDGLCHGRFPTLFDHATYRDLEYVQNEIRSLAEQLAAVR